MVCSFILIFSKLNYLKNSVGNVISYHYPSNHIWSVFECNDSVQLNISLYRFALSQNWKKNVFAWEINLFDFKTFRFILLLCLIPMMVHFYIKILIWKYELAAIVYVVYATMSGCYKVVPKPFVLSYNYSVHAWCHSFLSLPPDNALKLISSRY